MAIKITEDGNVTYENEPTVERELLPNITDGEQYAKQAEEALERIEEIAESIPEDYTQLLQDVATLEDSVSDLEEDVEELQNNYTPLAEDVGQIKNDYTTILDSAYVTDTASGSIASFPDGADDIPVKSLKVNIEPVQAGTGDPSPDNIRPISGHATAKVTRCGKNLLNRDTEKNGFINADGGIQMDSVSVHSALMAVTEEEKYTFSGIASTTAGTGNKRIHGYDVNGNWVRQLSYLPIEIGRPYVITVTIPNGIKYVRVSHYSTDTECLFEKSEIATAYEPYTAQTVTIALGGTIYGGTLDVTTGVLTVDRAMVDLGTLNWGYASGEHPYMYVNYTNKAQGNNIICSNYPTSSASSAADMSDKSILGFAGNTYVAVKDSAYTDAPTFKTAMNGVQLVYELATPQTYQLTPEEVKTVLGQNNIFADTGDVTVQYRADTKLYIDKVLNA